MISQKLQIENELFHISLSLSESNVTFDGKIKRTDCDFDRKKTEIFISLNE